MPRRPIPEIPDPRGRQLAGMLARDAYTRWLQREITAVLGDTFREIQGLIERSALTGTGDRARLAQLGARVTQLLDESYRGLEQRTVQELAKYASVEAQAAGAEIAALVRDAGGVMPEISTSLLTRGTVESIARLPIEGLPLGDWWQAQARAMSLAVRRQIQVGLTLGENPTKIALRIIPPGDDSSPAVWRAARAQATAIVRTATTAVHADADMRSYESVGERVSAEYELLTARDNRVSKICAPLDGQVFRYDDPHRKVPPFHINCRTTTIPRLNYRALGIKPPGKTSPLNFQTFDSWLRGQPASTQAEILGPARADLYAAGKTSLRDLVDSDNRVLTLEQLRARLGTAAEAR